jgi:hypothetical protein
MKERILAGAYSFPRKKRTDISIGAQNVIRSMLDTNPVIRSTIEEILNSHWMTVS